MTVINISPYDTNSFSTSLWIKVDVTPSEGNEYAFEYANYLIRMEDISEIRKNMQTGFCSIVLESGLWHVLDTTNATITVGEHECTDLYVQLCTATAGEPYTP
jgi:hypothetical protein